MTRNVLATMAITTCVGASVIGASLMGPASAATSPVNTPESSSSTTARITSIGGINLVPTPSGLKLGDLTEDTMASCFIGSGCAARSWTKLVGANANDPDQIVAVDSNVGIVPTKRLATRDMKALKEQFQTFMANSGFVGAVKQTKSAGLVILKIHGKFDQTVDDEVRIVQARQGRRTVYMAVNLDNRVVNGTLPTEASIANMTKKAKKVFTMNWSQVPATVLPN